MGDNEAKHTVHVNEQRCKGADDCGICIYICPANVFDRADRLTQRGIHPPVVARPDACTGCGNCMIYCPDLAIVVERKRESAGSRR